MEETLSEYLNILCDEEKADLDEAMKEYATGKTTSLDDAERILELLSESEKNPPGKKEII